VAASLSFVEAALSRLATSLVDVGAAHALVGGLAVSARTEPRTTRDVDVAIAVAHDDAAEALVFALQARGYVVKATVEQTATGRLATTRLVHAQTPAVFADLLFASSGIEPEIVARAEILELIPGLRFPVASRGHLIALKVLSRDDRRRPQDWDDLRALLREAPTAEVDEAREAVRLIHARRYHRGRDLEVLLDEMIADVQ
jgi:predicted nucleotidyltransferase